MAVGAWSDLKRPRLIDLLLSQLAQIGNKMKYPVKNVGRPDETGVKKAYDEQTPLFRNECCELDGEKEL